MYYVSICYVLYSFYYLKKSLKQLRCLKNNPDTKKKRGNRKGAFIATPVKSK